MTEAIKTLHTEGVAMMPYTPELRTLVEDAAAAWQEFCTLPLNEKQRLAQAGSNVGYEYKDGVGYQADRKENFDITTSLSDNQLIDGAEYDFINKASAVSRAMADLAINFAHQAEETFAVSGLTKLAARSVDQIFTRFLHYFGDRQAGESTATAHCDQSGYTFHLHETAGGCQRLDETSRTWQDMPVAPGKLAAFPAMQLQLLSHGELKALPHRVIATDETKELGRYAVVCFVRLKQAPQYNKEKYGRLQEFTPGFNYDMPYEQFKQLFR